MEKDLYIVTIPATLTKLFGKQNVREEIERVTKWIFQAWAHPDLVEKIQVTKPRVKKTEESNDE